MKIFVAYSLKNEHQVKFICKNLKKDYSDNDFEFIYSEDIKKESELHYSKKYSDKFQINGMTFIKNKNCISNSNLIIAFIDEVNPETIWNIGFSHAINIPIVTCSFNGKIWNTYIDFSILRHYHNMKEFCDNWEKLMNSWDIYKINVKK